MPDREGEDGGEAPTSILPIFAPAFRHYWQVIVPKRPLVYYLPEREPE